MSAWKLACYLAACVSVMRIPQRIRLAVQDCLGVVLILFVIFSSLYIL